MVIACSHIDRCLHLLFIYIFNRDRLESNREKSLKRMIRQPSQMLGYLFFSFSSVFLTGLHVFRRASNPQYHKSRFLFPTLQLSHYVMWNGNFLILHGFSHHFFLIFLFCSENCYHFYGNDGALMEIKGNQDKLMVIDCFTSHQSSMSVDTPNLLNWVSFMYLSEKFCGKTKTNFLSTFSCWKGGEMPIPDMISNPCHIPGTVGIPIKVIHFRVHEAQDFTEHNY